MTQIAQMRRSNDPRFICGQLRNLRIIPSSVPPDPSRARQSAPPTDRLARRWATASIERVSSISRRLNPLDGGSVAALK